jgi:UDP-2,4-diacetamido-2,4,6-trideoxy-beta-L-altropyranose hydrolase
MQAEKKAFPVFRLADLPTADWQADAEATAAVLAKLGQRVDWLIVDHYGLDARWEEAVRPYARRIMVIDDLANRPHCCDLLLDANYYSNPEGRYAGLLPPGAELLLGPRYALLRPEFFCAGERLRPRVGTLDRLLAFFGGSDATNETEKLLTALAGLPERSFTVDVVVGEANHRRLAIERRCTSLAAVGFHCQIDNMAKMIAAADLAVGAGGTSLWERCYLGLPSIVIAVADNQVETAQALAAVGAIHYLGFHTEVDAGAIASAIACLAADTAALMAISAVARKIVPGNGPEAVVSRLLAAGVAKRQVKSPRASAANILVTSASRKNSLLQAVKAAAAKTGAAGSVIAADSDPACLARHFADDFWNMPPLAEPLTQPCWPRWVARRALYHPYPRR